MDDIQIDLYVLAKGMFDLVVKELEHAIKKHGCQDDITLDRQHIITAEEFGEIAMAINDGDLKGAKKEILQTVAMLVKEYRLINKLQKK